MSLRPVWSGLQSEFQQSQGCYTEKLCLKKPKEKKKKKKKKEEEEEEHGNHGKHLALGFITSVRSGSKRVEN